MVRELQAKGCIESDSVAAAFSCVPRHLFLPGVQLEKAYVAERAISTHCDESGSSISSSSAPTIMAVMLEQLSVEPGHRVLEIGAGTGYNAALLARLAGGSGTVVTVDFNPEVAAEAVEHLAAAGVTGVRVMAADGWYGAADHAPFDRIVAAVGVWDISPHWLDQLRMGGILVAPLWLRPGLQTAVAFERTDAGLVSRSMAHCGFMPLRGPHAAPRCQAIVPHRPTRAEAPFAEGFSIAIFDDASPDRTDVLCGLLNGSAMAIPSPALFPGWNMRLVLEEPDPILLTDRAALGFGASGLFDSRRESLAFVDGRSILGFGDPSCLERVEASLRRSVPFDLSELNMSLVPHDVHGGREADVILDRPSFDLYLTGISR
jgi:protein-L-isoaspartate(D-aspartate) O-methyltransferase